MAHLYSTLYLSLSFRLFPSCSRVWLLASLCGFASLGLRPCLSVLTTVTLFLPPGSLPACSLLPLLFYIPVFSYFMALLSPLLCVRGLPLPLTFSPKLTSADPTGLTTSPARGRLQCYTCSFAKPCDPVLTECQEDEVCGISVGTSGRTLVQWPSSGWLLASVFPGPQPQRSSFVP